MKSEHRAKLGEQIEIIIWRSVQDSQHPMDSANQILDLFEEHLKPKGKSIEERQNDFVQLLKPFSEKYTRESLNEFFSYWTEHNEKGRLMRFEMKKNQPFNVGRRLGTWNKNNKNGRDSKSLEQAINEY